MSYKINIIGDKGEVYVNVDDLITAMNDRAWQYHLNGDDELAEGIMDITETFRDFTTELIDQINVVDYMADLLEVSRVK